MQMAGRSTKALGEPPRTIAVPPVPRRDADSVHEVRLHYDFISPYSWLALLRSREFAAEHSVDWKLCPVVYAKLLESRMREHRARCVEAINLYCAGHRASRPRRVPSP